MYRPVNQAELDLIAADWRAFPPRLPEQPIFYPVTNESYATRFPVQNVGSPAHDELWVPAEELAEFNRHIIGPIELVQTFRREG